MSCMQVRLDFASVPITFDCLERRYRLQVDTVFSVHLGNVFVYRSEEALNQPDAMFEHEDNAVLEIISSVPDHGYETGNFFWCRQCGRPK